jgi:hypothetical protein
MRVSGTDRKSWQNIVDRGEWHEKPKGNPRQFGRDDMVALGIFNQLCGIGANPSGAARLASLCLGLMRKHENLEFLHVIAARDAQGKPAPRVAIKLRPGEDELIKFRIAVYRRQAVLDIAAAQKGQI